MITEEGVVTRVDADVVRVKTVLSAACKDCASHGACEAAREGEVEAVNPLGARLGDSVVVGFESASFVKISILLYLFPVVCMIIGAVAGAHLAPRLHMGETDLSAIGAFSFFIISFFCIRLYGNRLSGNRKYQARIIRIRSRVHEG